VHLDRSSADQLPVARPVARRRAGALPIAQRIEASGSGTEIFLTIETDIIYLA
jgi:hypothetical protein